MKKVEAIVRKSKFSEVKKALISEGYEYFTYWLVRDMGQDHETRIYRGVTYKMPADERIWLSMVLDESSVEKAVELIISSGRTGDAGDGRILVTELADAYRIKTGVHGDEIFNYND